MGVILRSSNYGYKVKGLKEKRVLLDIYGATGMVGT